jgi:hypothetical protein
MAKIDPEQFYTRILHRAFLRDGRITHTGEALALALLLHAKGKTQRGESEVQQVSRMLNDPNLDKSPARRNPRKR